MLAPRCWCLPPSQPGKSPENRGPFQESDNISMSWGVGSEGATKRRDEMDLTRNEAFIFSDAITREKYAKEYQDTQLLYFGGFPSFVSIIERIASHLS